MENNKKIRLRFAPSPTGSLHIGSLRTVLFDYLSAKSLGGKLILRIEDTDKKREVEGAVEGLISILDWAGIKFDEGPHVGGPFGPYKQTERLDIYKKHLQSLLESGHAYRCFCTPERLQEMRESQQALKQAPRYDRACRDLAEDEVKKRIERGEPFVIRQKMPLEGKVEVNDELRGKIVFNTEELEDHVLIKSDGVPTYQFASVVDDKEMEISHVIRGEEWIPSFPKNILLYRSFGWEPPKFIHMALTLNKGGGKLSKRQGDVAVEDYRAKGYLKEALLNFCALLGWHPKDDNELLELDEIIKLFKYEDMGTSPAVFDHEKLDYINGYYIRKKKLSELADLCIPFLENHWSREGAHINGKNIFNEKLSGFKNGDRSFIEGAIRLEQERMKILNEIGPLTEFLFLPQLNYPWEHLVWKQMTNIDVNTRLEEIISVLERIPDGSWTNDSIEDAVKTHIEAKQGRTGEYLWPMRVALSGKKASPGPFEIAEVLGKTTTLQRVKNAFEIVPG